ncbi:carbamoyltransferase [Sandaracinus amylolyticus]|uniref:Carbamoyltransferase n=1 Tax=Sandaracinus amylolyticus TaxID=927083 RepID=A0A0F6VYX7_9BACT|nr:carbamoyltransferase C-terminal domain-containing protein [Sandaracinus amylolyticus]AKF03193.1 Carbamoyltransferase [Sandaracinus amylolyticus]
MIVLGYHGGIEGPFAGRSAGRDAAAAIVDEGRVIAACEEARFARASRGASVPERAIRHCLDAVGLATLEGVDLVACSHASDQRWRAEMVTHSRARLSALTRTAMGAALAALRGAERALGGDEHARRLLEQRLGASIAPERFVAVPHDVAHAASAFFTSPFDRALCLVADAHGESAATSAAIGRGTRIEVVDRVYAPDSLGALYALFTRYLGFEPGEEHEVMLLAAHGDASHHRRFFRRVVQIRRDGIASVDPQLVTRLALRDAIAPHGTLYPRAMIRALGPARLPGEPLTGRHAHVAAALQEAVELALLASLATLRARTGERDLCLAGDLALNAAANARIARSGLFDRIHVQPAAHDAGTALGAALYAMHHMLGIGRERSAMPTPFLGASADDVLVDRALLDFADQVRATMPRDLEGTVAEALAAGRVVGWLQGRAEWGAKALGARSVLADPRRAESRARVSAILRRLEQDRSFSPAVPLELAHVWFDMSGVEESPHKLFSVPVRAERVARLPAVTHVDGTARVQTVSWEQSPRLHALLHAFGAITGVPVLLNTSFRVGREPLVNLPDDALRSFLASELDALVIGDRWIERRGEARAAEPPKRTREAHATPLA